MQAIRITRTSRGPDGITMIVILMIESDEQAKSEICSCRRRKEKDGYGSCVSRIMSESDVTVPGISCSFPRHWPVQLLPQNLHVAFPTMRRMHTRR